MNKDIRDTFSKEQEHYRGISNDEYTVNQMAAIATRAQYGISKEKLIKVLQGSEENK